MVVVVVVVLVVVVVVVVVVLVVEPASCELEGFSQRPVLSCAKRTGATGISNVYGIRATDFSSDLYCDCAGEDRVYKTS